MTQAQDHVIHCPNIPASFAFALSVSAPPLSRPFVKHVLVHIKNFWYGARCGNSASIALRAPESTRLRHMGVALQ